MSVTSEVTCNMCDLKFKNYGEYTKHRRTRLHKKKSQENMMDMVSEADAVDVKVPVAAVEEEEEYVGPDEIVEKQDDVEPGSYNQEVGNIEEDVLEDMESDVESKLIVKTEKDESEKEIEHSKDIDVIPRAYHCTICEQMFPNRLKIVKHLFSPFHRTQAVGKEEQYINLFEKYHKSVMQLSPFRCDICSIYFNQSKYLEGHLRSKAHKNRYEKTAMDVTCTLCNFTTGTNKKLMDHLQSSEHVKAVRKNDKSCIIKACKKPRLKEHRKYQITVCNVCPSEFAKKASRKSHFLTAEHLRQVIAVESQKEQFREKLEKDLNEISLKTTVVYNQIKEEKPLTVETEHDHQTDKFTDELSGNVDFGTFDDDSLNKDETGLSFSDNNLSHTDQDKSSYKDEIDVPSVLYPANDDTDDFFNEKEKDVKKPSMCKYCSFESIDYNEMRPHYMKEHAEMVKICDVCDMVFPHGKGYKLHVNSKEHQARIVKFGNKTEGKFQCHVCNKKFAEEGYAKFHTAYYHFHLNTEEDVLREYGRSSSTQVKYAEFISILECASKKEVLTCPECGARIQQGNMMGHLRGHTGEKPFKCNLCTNVFLNSSTLRRHLLVHFDLWRKSCEICGERFTGQTSYHVHMEIHRAMVTSEEKTNVCHICGDAFYVKRKLREHMLKHRNKAYKCDHPGCLWAFSNSHALKRHMITHSDSNEKPFMCSTCGYATKTEKYLLNHEKIHSKEKFLQCAHCPYKTATRTHLRRHMRIHLGTKPFKCPYCSYACNTHDNIRKHILETNFHKGLKVYPCRLCIYSTNCTKEFRTHLLTEHAENISADDLRGSSLAAFTGLFNKEEDIQEPESGMEIFPCKERKTRRKIGPVKDNETLAGPGSESYTSNFLGRDPKL